MAAGLADGVQEVDAFKNAQIDTHKISTNALFGTHERLKNHYLYRYAGAKIGIYGNSGEEAIYPAFLVDGTGAPLDAAQHFYTLRFEQDQLPSAEAFWSVTMYDWTTQLLVDNPLNRYLINSSMLPQLARDAAGGLTLYVQHPSPRAARERNWLPAPNSPFYVIMRIYQPRPEVLSGAWRSPPMQRVN